MSDSVGIEIVEVAAPSAEPVVFTLAAEPLWVLASDEADPTRVLHRVRGTLTRADDVVIANAGASELWFFEPETGEIRITGGPGDGPGEFSGMSGVYAIRGDSLAVEARQRFHILAPDGAYARTILPGGTEMLPGAVGLGFIGGTLFMQRIRFAQEEVVEEGIARRPVDILRFDLDGRMVDTLMTLPGWESFDDPENRMGGFPILFGRSASAIVGRAAVIVADKYENEARIHDGTGRLVRIIRPAGPPARSVTADEVAALRSYLIESAEPSMRAEYERIVGVMPARSTHAPFRTALAGDDGSVWLLLDPATSDATTLSALVYDEAGRPLGGARLPVALSVTEISREGVVGVWTDSLGVESVRAYAVERTR